MASIFKRVRKKPIPSGAEIVQKRGKRVAVWKSRGRTKRAELTPEGTAVLIPDANYTVEWFNCEGKRQRCSGGPDKDAAEQLGRQKETEAMQRRRGLIDPAQEQLAGERKRPLSEHLDGFEAKMRADGRDDNHVVDTLRYIRLVTVGCERIGDISADMVNAFASDLRAKGRSARTVGAYITAMKSFTRWMAVHGKLPADPLASVQRPNAKADRRQERRMLLPDEWTWLRTVTLATDTERHGMTAGERVTLYATAIQTGLRAGELRSLTRGRLFLVSDPPYVDLQGQVNEERERSPAVRQAGTGRGVGTACCHEGARSQGIRLAGEAASCFDASGRSERRAPAMAEGGAARSRG